MVWLSQSLSAADSSAWVPLAVPRVPAVGLTICLDPTVAVRVTVWVTVTVCIAVCITLLMVPRPVVPRRPLTVCLLLPGDGGPPLRVEGGAGVWSGVLSPPSPVWRPLVAVRGTEIDGTFSMLSGIVSYWELRDSIEKRRFALCVMKDAKLWKAETASCINIVASIQKVEVVMYFRRENLLSLPHSHLYFLCGSLLLLRGGGATQPCGAAAAGLTPKLALMASQAEVRVSVT